MKIAKKILIWMLVLLVTAIGETIKMAHNDVAGLMGQPKIK